VTANSRRLNLCRRPGGARPENRAGFTNFYLLVKICRYRRQFGALCDGALVPEVPHG